MKHLQIALPIALALQLFYLACLARQLPNKFGQVGSTEDGHTLRGKTARGLESRPGLNEGSSSGEPEAPSEQAPSSTSTYSGAKNRTGPGGSEHEARCGNCELRGQQRTLRIESIKERILRKLNLKTVPNMTYPLPEIPPLQHSWGGHGGDMGSMQGDSPGHEQYRIPFSRDSQNGANTKRIFTFAKPTPPELDIDDPSVCYFQVDGKTDGYTIAKASLYFYIRAATLLQTTVHLMTVSRVVKVKGRRGQIKLITVRKEKVVLSTRHGEWHNVELTDVVDDWIDDPGSNAGLMIELYDDNGESVVVTGVTDDQQTKKPFIQLRLHDAKRRRTRRAATMDCVEDQPEDRCCRYPLRVVFHDFNWDWILVPRVYNAYYCSGSCPRMRLQTYGHTYVMSMIEPDYEPCCSPSELAPLAILYFYEGDYIFKELSNMRVEACSCS